MTIGTRLKLIRQKYGLNLEQTASIFDITAQTLSRYENGKREPDNYFMESFGRHFNICGDWLLYGEPPITRAENKTRDIKDAFLELKALLNSETASTSDPPQKLTLFPEKLTCDTPENYLLMLEYMKKDPEVRKAVFQFFHLLQKPASDKRKQHAAAPVLQCCFDVQC